MTNYSEPLVRLTGGNRLITTSLAVSQHFGKKHKDILRAIQELDCSAEFGGRNFTPSSYTTLQNKKLPMYEITRDGFMFLCMGFTGAAAARWKERYILAFNAMEKIYADEQAPIQRTTLYVQNQTLQAELLKARPHWADILRYKQMGLQTSEVAKLIDRAPRTVNQYVRDMAALGYAVANEPQPEQLAQLCLEV